MSPDRETQILEAAQEMLRCGGYNNFSFRTIAAEVGVKSSSVHYHFATKEELCVAVTEYYTQNFLASLGEPSEILDSGKDPLEIYIQAFRNALRDDSGMCLCGVLSAEGDALPSSVRDATREFFQRNVDWLQRTYQLIDPEQNAKTLAIQTVSVLEGALITARALGDFEVFETAVSLIKAR